MNIQEILSKIQREEITVIYEEVRVQFDNAQQTPLGFKNTRSWEMTADCFFRRYFPQAA